MDPETGWKPILHCFPERRAMFRYFSQKCASCLFRGTKCLGTDRMNDMPCQERGINGTMERVPAPTENTPWRNVGYASSLSLRTRDEPSKSDLL